MEFIAQKIKDVVLIKPNVLGDHRGYFMESFRNDALEEFLGYSLNFCQDNESMSTKGVLRGLHFQAPPFAQSKLVRVIEGKVLDVAVDIRKESPTYGQSVEVELSSDNKHQLFIPRGFAHGFVVLSEKAVFSYKCDNYYSPKSDAGLAFNDPCLGINWILSEEILQLSDKDRKQPLLSEFESPFVYGYDYYEA